MKTTPIEALEKAISKALISACDHRHNPGVPGQIVSKMPKEVREALKELKSSDIETIRL
jgi:hypothetical protein